MKTAFLIVTLSTLLAGCATEAPRTEAIAAGAATAPAADPPAEAPSPEPANPLPDVELTGDLMFRLLSAEVAFQRGAWQVAYVTTLAAAHQTRDPRLARRAAEIAITAKQNGEAVAAIRLWRELAPNSQEAVQYLLGFIILGDQLDSAEPLLAERLAAAPLVARGPVILRMQRLLQRARDKAAAFRLLERLLTPYNTIAEARIALAQAAFNAGDAARSVAEARAALKLKPDSQLAVLTLAQALPDKGAAAAALSSFISANPTAREVRLAYARLQIDQKQFGKARAEFEALLKQKPDDLSSMYALGVLGSQSDDLSTAEKYLTLYIKTLAEKPDDDRDPSQALLLLAQIAEERKDIPAALMWLSQIEPGEVYLGAQVKRAQLMAKQGGGEVDAGLALLREQKADSPRQQVALAMAEAQLLRDAKRAAEAMTVMQAALRRFPADTDLLYEYAMMADKDGQFELMESTLRKLMEIAPKNQHAYNALGYSLAERNERLPEALKLIETALAITPDDPFILDSLGWVQYRLGMLKEAEASLRRAYSLRADPEIAVHLGEVLWVSGQKSDARKLWRDANTKDPDNGTLKNTLVRLHAEL